MHDEAFKAQKLQVQDKAFEHYHASLVNGVYIVDDCFTCSFLAIEVRKLVQCWVGFIFTISILLAYTTFGRGSGVSKRIKESWSKPVIRVCETISTSYRKKANLFSLFRIPVLERLLKSIHVFPGGRKTKGQQGRVCCRLHHWELLHLLQSTPGWLEVERGTQLREGSVHCWQCEDNTELC